MMSNLNLGIKKDEEMRTNEPLARYLYLHLWAAPEHTVDPDYELIQRTLERIVSYSG